ALDMRSFGILGIVAIVLILVVAFNSFFIVDQRKQALLLQVGAVVDAYNEPGTDEAGLKFKIPLI
ncbi:MAG: protease modulator HflC, partial [Henriciella sp.]